MLISKEDIFKFVEIAISSLESYAFNKFKIIEEIRIGNK